jgi:hypothetical protein
MRCAMTLSLLEQRGGPCRPGGNDVSRRAEGSAVGNAEDRTIDARAKGALHSSTEVDTRK